MRRDDLELLNAWRAGEPSAGNELFSRYYPLLLRFFINKIHGDPTDLIQETMLACVDSHHRLREGHKFRGFLFGIAYNKLKDFYKVRQLDTDQVDPAMHTTADLAPGPSTLMRQDEQQRLLVQALRRIPIHAQVLLELFYWQGTTSAEIATIMKIPHSTVRTRLRRARTLLEQALHCSIPDPQHRCSSI